MSRRRAVTLRCSHEGCPETALYDVRTVTEDREIRRKGYTCLRHRYPEQVLSPVRRVVTQTLVLTDKGHGRFWIPEAGVTGSGFAHGPGFMAYEADFPTGSRLIVEARVAPPLGQPVNSACVGQLHERCPGTVFIGHRDGDNTEPLYVACECECHALPTDDSPQESSPKSVSRGAPLSAQTEGAAE